MKRFVASLLVVSAMAGVANAQTNGMMCPGVQFQHVCTFLQPANEPGGDKVTMLVSEDAVVQLMLDTPTTVRMLTFDAIINQFEGDNVTPTQAFEVSALQGFNPGGNMEFQGWGDIVVPGFAADDNLQYLADTTELPLDANSGLPGGLTYVMGEITLHGLVENSVEGGQIRFHSPGGIGGDFGQVPAHLGSPGGFQNIGGDFADVSVFHSVGGDSRFNNFFGTPYQTFGVNVEIPEPASLSLLALGGFAALRRRR
jgi:hypothetical protein